MELRCSSIWRSLFYLLTLTQLVVSELSENVTDVHEASVEEVPNPTMTIEKGDMSDYHLPGYYTFNNGEPFYLEKDPLTGAVDFSKKSPITGYAGVPEFTSSSKQDRVTGQEKSDATESEYYEDDEPNTTDQDFKEDGIDRKDGNIDGYRPNDIDKNPFKISPDLHQFLNLPVHYSSSDKFPLISSSYANTKIQGTGSSSSSNNGGYSNHKYATTSSTQSPSYYTFKPSSATTSRPVQVTTETTLPPSPPSYLTSTKPKTTSSTRTTAVSTTTTTSSTPSTTAKTAFSEYNENEDLVYSDYDMEYGQPQNTYSYNAPPEPISSTTKRTPGTVFKPTVIPINDEYPTKKPIQNFTEVEEEFEEDVSIVTSLPVDVYYSQHTQSTVPKTTSTSPVPITSTSKVMTTTEQVRETTASPTTTTEGYSKSTTVLTTTSASTPPTTTFSMMTSEIFKPTPPSNYHFYGTKDNFEPMIDEPFRPIFGPHDSSSSPPTHKPKPVHNDVKPTLTPHVKPYFEYHSPSNAKPLPNQGKIEFVERVPAGEQINKYTHKPATIPKYPGVEPPRPNPPLVFANHGYNEHSSEQFGKQPMVPSQTNPLLYNSNEKQNFNGNPVRSPPQHESGNYGRPQSTNIQGSVLPEVGLPVRHPPQNQRPPFIRLPDDVPFYVKKHSNGTVTKIPKPEEIIYPQQRPVGVIPPSGLKQEAKPTNQVVKFHPPMKHENHFIKVPLDEENPSYSLQTSFSIGLPGDNPGDKENEKKTSQGVGQVLFPDGSIDTNLQSDKDKPIQPSPVRSRPTNTRPYITSYNQNNHPPQIRPQTSPSNSPSFQTLPSQILPQRPTSQRLPVPELRPPKPNGESYPRPHWEVHSKPHILFNSHQSSGQKQDMPPHFPAINKIKPDSSVQRPDLPNILPQFRPNAKIGSNEFGVNLGNTERLREPMDILQPPPLPQPQHLRVNRNDDSSSSEEIEKTFEESEATQAPLVHRRTGPQPANNRVTTLQMMQQGPPRRNLIRTDYHDNRPEKPVYLVYPANAGSKQQMQTQSSDAVVVGTRGPHQPVPPSNLKSTVVEKEDDSDLFPLDDEKQFSIPTRDRVDTPVLKTKTPNKPALKNDFPYEILKPQENILPEERIMAGSSPTKEYNAFSPTVSSSTEDIKDPDAEINLIPYLQDYMPIATKKPITQKPVSVISTQLMSGEKNSEVVKLPSTNKPISVTLNTKLATTTKAETLSDYIKNQKPLTHPENLVFGTNVGGKTEYTVGAVMHTNFVKKPVNHRPFEVPPSSSQPKPVDLEAPFQASLSAPESQGWTVVKSNSDKRIQEVDRQDVEPKNEEKHAETESKFDFDNFKPQLFGGFKPIIPSSEEKADKNKDSSQEKVLGRQEKTYR